MINIRMIMGKLLNWTSEPRERPGVKVVAVPGVEPRAASPGLSTVLRTLYYAKNLRMRI